LEHKYWKIKESQGKGGVNVRPKRPHKETIRLSQDRKARPPTGQTEKLRWQENEKGDWAREKKTQMKWVVGAIR